MACDISCDIVGYWIAFIVIIVKLVNGYITEVLTVSFGSIIGFQRDFRCNFYVVIKLLHYGVLFENDVVGKSMRFGITFLLGESFLRDLL